MRAFLSTTKTRSSLMMIRIPWRRPEPLQENNAILVVDLVREVVTNIWPLGFKDWSRFKLDASDRDNATSLKTYKGLVGLYQPDTITYATIGGKGYLFLANEGAWWGRAHVSGRSRCVASVSRPLGNSGVAWSAAWVGARTRVAAPPAEFLVGHSVPHPYVTSWFCLSRLLVVAQATARRRRCASRTSRTARLTRRPSPTGPPSGGTRRWAASTCTRRAASRAACCPPTRPPSPSTSRCTTGKPASPWLLPVEDGAALQDPCPPVPCGAWTLMLLARSLAGPLLDALHVRRPLLPHPGRRHGQGRV